MTNEELDFIGTMNMCDEISNEAYKKIVNHVEETEISDDCVSREQALLQLTGVNLSDKTTEELIKLFGGRIQSLPPVTPTQRWIPVSERLPESEGLYLVSVKNDHLRQYSKTCWFNSHRNWFSRQDVIAWQPLPKPYEEKRGSEND